MINKQGGNLSPLMITDQKSKTVQDGFGLQILKGVTFVHDTLIVYICNYNSN